MAQPPSATDSRPPQQPTSVHSAVDMTQPPEDSTSHEVLPPTHTLLFAADVFFRYCHNQPYSLFHEPTFRQRLLSGEVPNHLVWAMLSAARRYSSFPDLQINASDDAMFYASNAWKALKLPWNGGRSDEEVVSVLQTLILIVNIEHPCKHHFSLVQSTFMSSLYSFQLGTALQPI